MRKRRAASARARGLLALAPLLLALVLGCGTGGELNQLVVVHRGWPLTLTPHLKSETITTSVQSNIFEGLVGFDPNMKVIPLLAERWENPDDLTWVFKIRQGVKFHNGNLLKADDVIYSLQRAKSYPASAIRSDFVAVDSIIKTDDYTVVIKTARPHPILLNKLVSAFIIPKEYLERVGDEGFSKAPIGTGSYRFESFIPNTKLSLVIWDQYWGERPVFSKLTIIAQSKSEEAIKLLFSLEACLVPKLSATYARQIEFQSQKGIDIIREKGLTLRYLGLSTKIKPFNNPKVRRAISLSINRKQLVEKFLSGYGARANQLVPQAVFGYNPNLPEIPYDTNQAKKLLTSAGYPNGIKLSLLLSGPRQNLGEELQREMKPAGIRLTFNILEPEMFLAALDTCSFFLVGSVSNSGDVSDQFDDVIHSQNNGYGRENKGRYYNPQVDLLIEKSSGYFDSNQRLKALQEIMALVMKDPPRIPLYFEDEIYGVSKRVEWHPRLDMMVLGKEVRIRKGHDEFK